MSEFDSKKLSDLRVVDLRAELEKRGLDRSGNKQALVERLQKVCIKMSPKEKLHYQTHVNSHRLSLPLILVTCVP